MPSSPPPAYSLVNENNTKKPVEYPYRRTITSYGIAAICLLPGYSVFTLFFTFTVFATCVPTDRLLSCDFDEKMKYSDIYSLKKEVNATQKKVDEISNVMKYGLSTESSRTLLQKKNSINETLEALKQKYNHQKINFEKCYFDNIQTHNNHQQIFMQITALTLPFITIFLFAAVYYYTKKVPVNELNKEQTDAFKANNACNICCFGTLLFIVCGFVALGFIPALNKVKAPESIPIFVAESWENLCNRMPTITVEKFLISEACKNNV